VLSLVDAADFEDHRNPELQLAVWAGDGESSPQVVVPEMPTLIQLPAIHGPLPQDMDFAMPEPSVIGYESDDYQDRAYLLEIWIEKSTMNDILSPLCHELGVDLVPSVGTQSYTNAVKLLERCAKLGKPARVFYISDHDPKGDDMPVSVSRHLEFFRERYAPGTDIKLCPLMLTKAQSEGLPRTPLDDKTAYQRGLKRNFEMLYGPGRVELDALEAIRPGEFERIVRKALAPYIDEDIAQALSDADDEAEQLVSEAWDGETAEIKAELDKIGREARAIAEKYGARCAALNDELQAELKPLKDRLEEQREALAEKCESFDAEIPQRPEPQPAVDTDDEADWLFDSSRDYLEQLKFYKRRKATEKVEKADE
jgi:hypothetical protein